MSPPTPRIIKVIGIGAGSPWHLTQEAIAALRAVDVLSLIHISEPTRPY